MRLGPMDWGLLVLLSLLWGGSFLCVGIAVQELPVLTIIALRVSLAALVLWGIALFSGHQLPRGRKTWQAFLALGLLNNVIPFGLIVFGQQTIGAGLAAILNATTPLWTVLIAALFLADERFSKQKLFGVLLGPQSWRAIGSAWCNAFIRVCQRVWTPLCRGKNQPPAYRFGAGHRLIVYFGALGTDD